MIDLLPDSIRDFIFVAGAGNLLLAAILAILLFALLIVRIIVLVVKEATKKDVERKNLISKEVARIDEMLAGGKVTASEAADLKQALGAAAFKTNAPADKNIWSWGMACHLSSLSGYLGIPLGHFLGPLILWLIKRNEHDFIDEQGKEALNFQMSMWIYIIISAVFSILLIGIPFLIIFLILDIILPIVAAIKASRGESYRYPFTIRFL